MQEMNRTQALTRTVFAAAMSLAAAAAATARAETPVRAEAPDPARAKALVIMREGNALLDQGRAADALVKFEEAYRTFASPKLHYNLGQAHAALAGHDVETYEQMTLFLDQAPDASGELRAGAEKERSKRRAVIGLVSIQATPPDANLLVDGAASGKVAENTMKALKPGAHTFSLVSGSATSAPISTVVRAGETASVTLRLQTAEAPPLPLRLPVTALSAPDNSTTTTHAAVDVAAKPSDDSRPLYRRPWFWGVVGGVAAAALVTTIVVTSSHEGSWSNIPDVNANTPQ